jgi:type VI secretion system protein ImpK
MTRNDAVARPRSNSLGLAFQDVITAIVRFRYRTQHVADATAFRASIRNMITAGVQETRRIGYSDRTAQIVQYAIVDFLDESVALSNDAAFQTWGSHTLRQELFAALPPGEHFFANLTDLLARPESFEIADALEIHATCLLLGYRGKYASGDAAEIQEYLRRIREKLVRIRGPVKLCRLTDVPIVAAHRADAPAVRRLALLTALIVLLAAVAFAGYWFLLNNSLNSFQALLTPALAVFRGGLTR